jgi:hypothetical protein
LIDKTKKTIEDIEFDIQDTTEYVQELEAEVEKKRAFNTRLKVRERVGEEKYRALETAVRDLLEYADEVGEQPTRGQKNARTRRETKVNKLVNELNLSPAEQAVVQTFVQERVNNKREAEAKMREEREINKAAAERGKKEATLRTLNNQLVQATRELIKLESIGATESMKAQVNSVIDSIRAEIDSLMDDSPSKAEAPVSEAAIEETPEKKPAPKQQEDPTADKTSGRKLTNREIEKNKIVNKAYDRIKKLGDSPTENSRRRYLAGLKAVVTKLNGFISAVERTGDTLELQNLLQDLVDVRANVGRAMNLFLDKTEGMSNEQVEALEARFESPYSEFLEALKTENPINAFEKTFVEALGKGGVVLLSSFSTAEASPVLKEVIEAEEEVNEINEKLDKLAASSSEAKALKARQKELMRIASGEAIAERQQAEAVQRQAEVDDAEIARLEEDLRKAQEDLDFYNRDEPDNTKYPKYKSFKQAKEAINAGKDPRFKGKEDNPTFPAQGANQNLDEKFMAEQRIPFITGMETTMVMEDSARAALESINRTYRATKSRDTTGVGQELEDTVEALKKELAEAKRAPVDDVAKRQAGCGSWR